MIAPSQLASGLIATVLRDAVSLAKLRHDWLALQQRSRERVEGRGPIALVRDVIDRAAQRDRRLTRGKDIAGNDLEKQGHEHGKRQIGDEPLSKAVVQPTDGSNE